MSTTVADANIIENFALTRIIMKLITYRIFRCACFAPREASSSL